MSKLEELRQFVKTQFDNAETNDKKSIDMLAKIQSGLDDVVKEQEQIESKNVELTKSYKELVKHTSFNDADNAPKEETKVASEIELDEDFLKKFANK